MLGKTTVELKKMQAENNLSHKKINLNRKKTIQFLKIFSKKINKTVLVSGR